MIAPRWVAPSNRLLSTTLLLSFGVLILLLASPPLVGRVHVGDDLGNLHLPVRSLYQDALRAGQSVLWSPYLYAGMYLHGEGQAGMYHPVHLLLYRFLPLPWAFTLEFVLSYALMFPGMYLLLSRLDLPRPAALFGAFVFTFSGFNLLHFMHVNAIAVVAHIPWLLVGVDLLLRGADSRRIALGLALVSLGTGSQLLLGHPQFVWLSVVAEAAYTAWRVGRGVSPWRVGLVLWAIGLGVLLGGIQLVPTIDALLDSERSNPSTEFRATFSLHPANLLQLVSPYGLRGRVLGGNVQEFGLYDGAVSTVAAGWLLLRWRALGRWRSLVLASSAFGLVMLLLALGSYGGLYSLLSRLPGVGVFRAPARYILLLHLALAVVAAVMMADLMRLSRRTRRQRTLPALWPIWLVGGTGLATLGVHAWLKVDPGRHPAAAHLWPVVPFALLGAGLIVAASLLVLAAFRGVRWAPWCLAVFTVADLTLWGGSFVWRERPQPLARWLDVLPAPPAGARDGRVHVTGGMDWLYQDVLAAKGYRLASGYVGLRPRRVLSPDDVTGQRLLAVRWVFERRALGGGPRSIAPDPAGGGSATDRERRGRPGHDRRRPHGARDWSGRGARAGPRRQGPGREGRAGAHRGPYHQRDPAAAGPVGGLPSWLEGHRGRPPDPDRPRLRGSPGLRGGSRRAPSGLPLRSRELCLGAAALGGRARAGRGVPPRAPGPRETEGRIGARNHHRGPLLQRGRPARSGGISLVRGALAAWLLPLRR